MPGPIYPESLAARCRDGGPYRPSNGTEGALFEEAWCEICAKDELWRETGDGALGCGIHTRAICHDVGQPEYPLEWCHDEQGQPCCTAYVPAEPQP